MRGLPVSFVSLVSFVVSTRRDASKRPELDADHRPALGLSRLRRRGGGGAGGGAGDRAGRRAAAVSARALATRSSRGASSIRRSIICTIRCRSPTWAWRSIASSAAIARKERIAIHGDYDVDGVTSTVILRRALELLGADVVHFIPERLQDGYGLQPAAIERLHADGVALVDLGRLRHPRRRGGAARARARRRSDHHRPPRARHRAAAGAGRHQPEAARLHAIPTSTSPASASR